MLVVLSLFYLRLAGLLFRVFSCTEAPDSGTAGGGGTSGDMMMLQQGATGMGSTPMALFLQEDLQTRCWRGEHLAAAAGSVILIIVYIVGFPAACWVLLMRAFSTSRTPGVLGWLRRQFSCLRWTKRRRQPNGQHNVGVNDAAGSDEAEEVNMTEEQLETRRRNMYGFLYLGLRPSCFCAGLYIYPLRCWLAGVGVLADLNPLLELFGFALAYALVSGFLIAVRPYVLWRRNMQNIVVGLATCVHSLWMVGAHSGGGTERVVYLAVLLALLGVVLLAFLGRETALGHSAWLRTHFSSAEQLEQEERLAAKRQALKTIDDDGQDDDAMPGGRNDKEDAPEGGRSFASVSFVDDEGAACSSGKDSGGGKSKGSSERETEAVDPMSSSEKSAGAGVEVEMVSINHSFPDSSANSGRKSSHPPPPPPPLPPSAVAAAGRTSAVSRCSPPPPLPHANAASEAALQANPALQLEDTFEEAEASEPPPPPPPPRSSRLSGPPALPAQTHAASPSSAAAVPPPPLPPSSSREFASVHENTEDAVSQEDAAPLQENWAVASDDVHVAEQEEE
jgi:hypothetical protein